MPVAFFLVGLCVLCFVTLVLRFVTARLRFVTPALRFDTARLRCVARSTLCCAFYVSLRSLYVSIRGVYVVLRVLRFVAKPLCFDTLALRFDKVRLRCVARSTFRCAFSLPISPLDLITNCYIAKTLHITLPILIPHTFHNSTNVECHRHMSKKPINVIRK